MLTEVDTRESNGQSVSLFMDTDAQVYLVCVEGHEPITCLSRDYALQVWHHPFAYIPSGGRVTPSAATEGSTPTPLTPGGDLAHRTADALIGLRNVLAEMNTPDFEWTCASVMSMLEAMSKWHHEEHETGAPPEPADFQDRPKPYDQDGPEIEF